MSAAIIFKTIREPALNYWLTATKRVRKKKADQLYAAFECDWQNRFGPVNPADTRHYSVFCGVGESNTNMTDMLDDKRYDKFVFDQDSQDVLFRYYTRIYLIASEILTDFQDILTVFRTGDIKKAGNHAENNTSRSELVIPGQPDKLQNLFDFINKIFKHKTRNIHSCNHHLHLHFEDSGQVLPTSNFLGLTNAKSILKSIEDGTIANLPEHIIIPSLQELLSIIVHCYQVVDQKFRTDPGKFQAFCLIYEGVSVRS